MARDAARDFPCYFPVISLFRAQAATQFVRRKPLKSLKLSRVLRGYFRREIFSSREIFPVLRETSTGVVKACRRLFGAGANARPGPARGGPMASPAV
jgi:hypothetical protein